MKKSEKKKKPEVIDGISPKDLARIRTALRQVWSWSVMHRLVRARCKVDQDYAKCEQCGETVPKVYVDHINPCGDVLEHGYIDRMFVSSVKLQGLCRKCHSEKTKQERQELKPRQTSASIPPLSEVQKDMAEVTK